MPSDVKGCDVLICSYLSVTPVTGTGRLVEKEIALGRTDVFLLFGATTMRVGLLEWSVFRVCLFYVCKTMTVSFPNGRQGKE